MVFRDIFTKDVVLILFGAFLLIGYIVRLVYDYNVQKLNSQNTSSNKE